MAGKGQKPGSGGFDPSENVNSNTLKRHPKMDLSRNDLLQLLSYLEGELQARDVAIATLKAEKAKQLLYQAKYGRFGLGDPFTAMQRDSDNMKDNSFDESAIKCMYDNQLAQLENLIATQRKAQMKMREQMITSDKKYQKVCSELDDEKKKHAQDTAQGDDVTYMLEKERERLKQEIEFEKSNVRKMEKDLKKTLVSLEEERASSGKHKQVALMLIKERKTLVEKYMIEKRNAEDAERLLLEERTKAMNMAEGLVQESKKSLKMEATMERQLSEFDLEREQMRNKLLREENRNRDLQSQVESLRQQLDTLQKQTGKSPKDSYHSVEIKSQISSPQVRLSSERTQGWSSQGSAALNMSSAPSNDSNVIEREAGLSPRNSSPSDVSVRKRDTRYASPQPHNIERSGGGVQYHDSAQLETRVAPVGASDRNASDPQQTLNKLNIQLTGGHHHQGGQTVTTSGGSGRITVQTGSPTPGSGPVSPRRVLAIGRGVPPPIPPNKPVLSVTSANMKPVTQKLITNSSSAKENRVTTSGSKPVHIPVSVVHTSSVTTSASSRAGKQREGSPSSIRKPAQLSASLPLPATTVPMEASSILSNSDSFDFLGPEMADLQQLLVSMVTVSPDSTGVETTTTAISTSISTSSISSVSSPSSSTSLYPSSSTSQSFLSSAISENSQIISSSTPENSKPSLSGSNNSQPRSSLLSPSSYTVSVVASAQFSTLSATSVMSSPSSTPSPSSSITSLSPPSTFPSSSSSFVPPPVLFNTSPPMSLSPSSVSSPNSVSALPTSPVANYPAEERTSFSLRHERGHLSRTDKGLLPPTASQSVVDAWSLHQHGNRDLPHSPIHRYASCGDKDLLRKLIVDLDADVNLPMKDGTTPCHCAAENGQEDCLKLLISRGGNINCLRDDQLTPVHCAAAQGHSQCLELLLTHGGLSHIADQSMWTPLHWSAANGHVECCKQLIKRGAKRTAMSNTNWTPCHMAVHAGHVDCLDLLLTFESDKSDKLNAIKPEISRVKDRDGWSLAHLAASKESSDCLSVILAHCDIDVHCRDKLGRSVMDVSSASVRQILMPYVSEEQVMHVTVEMTCTGLSYHQQQPYVIGTVGVTTGMSWFDVYRVVSDLCEGYFDQVDRGLHSKKISRLDPDGATEGGRASLGLNKDSICSLDIGSFSFNEDSTNFPDIMPYKCLSENNIDCISVKLKGFEGAYSSFAFDLLMPVSTISNYIRLLEQYRSVIFYGPEGTRKKQLVKRLSHHIANKEHSLVEVRVIPVYVHRDYSNRDFIQLLKDNGCMIPTDCAPNTLCILMLFHLEKVNFTQMFGSLLQHMDSRGRQHSFYMTDANNIQESFYLSDHFYLIATMDKPRSIGLDLSTQQRFRWVNFCVNVEPIRNLLARHLLRRLIHAYGGHAPTLDDPVFKAVEWLVCVWQRLNDGASKLGLPDVAFGPEIFLPCPLESKQAQGILEWMKKLWNETISSAVKAAIQKGKENRGDNAGKVTSTALYVLLQRVIVPGCPLTGKEKEDYLKQFQGSNELDIPLNKADKSPNISVAGLSQRRPLYDSKRPVDDEPSFSKAKHRNSFDGDGRFLFTHTVTANTPKRRSLSETHLGQTEQIEIPIMHQQRELSKSQPKVPKLEIRSPVLGLTVPLPSNMHPNDNLGGTSMLSSLGNSYDIPTRRSTFSSHSKIPQAISKRSRSTEATQRAQTQGRSSPFRPPKSPFSFSLTTPTSSLFSFKFLDNNNKDEVSRQSVFNSSRERESQC